MDRKSSSAKHTLIMLACCLIPLGLLGAVLFLKVDLGGFALVAILLLCPLLHVLMMRGLGPGHGRARQGGQAGHGDVANSPRPTPRRAEAAQPIIQKGS